MELIGIKGKMFKNDWGQSRVWGNENEAAGLRVAIIGGGFAGTAVAAQLLRRAGGMVSVTLIEKNGVPGQGVAYGTRFDGHLLNVRAQGMSAYPDIPDHFVRWAQANFDPSVQPGDFLPRRVYGEYVQSLLQEQRELHPKQFDCIQDEAVSLTRTGDAARIQLRSGGTIFADRVVLALGNFPPGDLHLPGKTSESRRYVANPWLARTEVNTVGDVGRSDSSQNILLIGSGLTAVDVAIELRARGFGETIHMLSRRGLLPQVHKSAVCMPSIFDGNFPRRSRVLLHEIRLQVERAEAEGDNWRAVIDSIRPMTQKIWHSLPIIEQRRFLRHVRPYWEIHRHRVAPQIGEQLYSELSNGQIQIHAGRITEYGEDAGGVTVQYRARASGKSAQLRVDRVINCTGPEADFRRANSPLLSDLLQKGLACADSLSLGLKVENDGALIADDGTASDILFTLGSSRKGTLWETTAVPEIRVQAAELAALLHAQCAESLASSAA
jgi:uncharacterized NAD(P)/FAD-binding protein YdhS